MIYKGQIIYIYQIKQKIKETFIIHKKGHYLTQKKTNPSPLVVLHSLHLRRWGRDKPRNLMSSP